MNIQFVAGVYARLTYLTSYLCKPEHTMSKLMKKALKEADGKDINILITILLSSLIVCSGLHKYDVKGECI